MSEIVAYNNLFDVDNYEAWLTNGKDLEKKQKLDSYTQRQLETHIGERFNALLSTTHFDLRDGLIYGENMDGPFIDSIIRGRNYRRINGNPINFAREDAEVFGFAKIENFMASVNEGEMVMSISKPGEDYPHNFIDVFTKKKGEKGDYVEARRYSTALTTEEYIEFARSQGVEAPNQADDAFFLENPFKITTFQTPDEVHQFLHRDHDYITPEELTIILRGCEPFMIAHLNALAWGDLNLQRRTFNDYLNAADDLHFGREILVGQEEREVREVASGCGTSAGFSMTKDGKLAPFSVEQFGREYPFDKFGTCRNCKGEGKMLGPCKVCEPCDDGIRTKQKSLLS